MYEYAIMLPKGQEFNSMACVGLVKTLIDRLLSTDQILELVAEAYEKQIYFVVRNYDQAELTPEAFASLVTPFYPGAVVQDHYIVFPTPAKSRTVLMKRAYDLPVDIVQLPISSFKATTDPLVSMIQALGSLEPGEYLNYTITVMEKTKLTYSLWQKALIFTLDAYQKQHNAMASVVRQMRADKRREIKRNQELYNVSASFTMVTPNPQRFQLLDTVASTLRFMADDLYPVFDETIKVDVDIKTEDDTHHASWAGAVTRIPEKQQDQLGLFVLPEELATMWHLPHTGFDKTHVRWASAFPKQLMTDNTLSEKYCRIGRVEEADAHIGLNRADRRYHTYITGQTGMGKSTLLHRLICEDIASGCGVVVIDPHGSLITDILNTKMSRRSWDDAVLIECGDTEYPVPLNPFRLPEGVDEIAVFNAVLWILKSIYASNWSQTRMETVFRNILQVVLADPNSTPLDIQEIITNANYRRKVIAEQTKQGKLSRAARNWWHSFDDATASEQRSQTQSVLSRLNAFLGSPHIERMTCHPNTIDFRALIRDKKIVLVNLKGDAIASEVGSLGAVFLAQFYLASLSLGDISGNSPPRFYLYVDETQRFITTSLPEMFSEARKFGLSLTLANQYLGQLDEETREGILKNVGTKFSFACHPDEASLTGKMYEPDVQREQLPKLGRGSAVVKTRYEGESLPAFVVKIYNPPPQRDEPPDMDAIRQRTREYLGILKASEVTTWIDKRYDGDLFKKPPTQVDLADFDTGSG